MAQQSSEDEQWYHWHLLTLLSVSAAMVGVCLTAISLVGILKWTAKLEQIIVDDMLAIAALLFVAVCFLCFLGIRTRIRKTWKKFSITVDVLFCLGLVVVVVASMLLTWAVI
jgi:integral membrane sensor domain MASE1